MKNREAAKKKFVKKANLRTAPGGRHPSYATALRAAANPYPALGGLSAYFGYLLDIGGMILRFVISGSCKIVIDETL